MKTRPDNSLVNKTGQLQKLPTLCDTRLCDTRRHRSMHKTRREAELPGTRSKPRLEKPYPESTDHSYHE